MPVNKQGTDQTRYTLIPRTLIFLTRGEEVLLLKGAAHKRLWANLYNGYGGHIERGEDPLSAARRELLEECGLQAGLWLAATVTIDTGADRPGILLFEPHWVQVAALPDLPLVEDLYTLLPRVLNHPPTRPPIHFLYTYDAQGQLHIRQVVR